MNLKGSFPYERSEPFVSKAAEQKMILIGNYKREILN